MPLKLNFNLTLNLNLTLQVCFPPRPHITLFVIKPQNTKYLKVPQTQLIYMLKGEG